MKKTLLLLSVLVMFTGCSSKGSAAENTDVFDSALIVDTYNDTQITTAPETNFLCDTSKSIPEDSREITPFSLKDTDDPVNDVRINGTFIFVKDEPECDEPPMYIKGNIFHCDDGTELFISNDQGLIILEKCDVSQLCSGDCVEIVTDLIMESDPPIIEPASVMFIEPFDDTVMPENVLKTLSRLDKMGYHTDFVPVTTDTENTVINDLIVTTITERPPTDRQVTAEEFEEELGFRLNIPEGAEVLEYKIDYSSPNLPVGFANFNLDGILWNATVMRTDRSYYRDDLFEPYKIEYDELDFTSENNQVIEVHGAEPDVLRYFLIHYNSDIVNDAYTFNAYWFLEDEGLELTLKSYSEQPVHKVPVEIFGQ